MSDRVEGAFSAARVPWLPGDLVLGIVGALALFAILSVVIVAPFVAAFGEDAAETLAAQGAAVALWDAALVGLVLLLIGRRGSGLRDLRIELPGAAARPFWDLGALFGRSVFPGLGLRGKAAAWVYVVLSAVSAYVTCQFILQAYVVIVSILGIEALQPEAQLEEGIFDSAWVVAVYGLSVVAAAPLAEEVFFRGFLFAGLRRVSPFLVAGLLSGGLFSLAHASPAYLLPFTGVGLVLAYLYERSGTLLPSIGMHFLFNALSFLLMVFIPEARG